jgi:hypothetical protein
MPKRFESHLAQVWNDILLFQQLKIEVLFARFYLNVGAKPTI